MKMKRIAALLLAALLLVPAAGLAEDEELTNEKEFVYVLAEDGTAEIVGYTGGAKKLKIPSAIDGYPVTAIGERAFYGNQILTEITVPEGVITIGHEAFGFCVSLETLHLPDGLTELARGAVRYCKKLIAVNLPDSVTKAGGSLFGGCDILEKVQVSAEHPYFSMVDGVLFSRPDHRLIWYPMPKEEKTYVIPEGTEIIEDEAFHRSGLVRVTVPESMKKLQYGAFSSCKKLQKINIPSQVTDLNGAFDHCASLTHIDVSAKNPVYESKNGVLFRKAEKELVFYPAGRKDKTYKIPQGTLSIGQAAFSESKISAVTIPGSVKKIKDNAFIGCKNLKKVTVPEGVKEFLGTPFQRCEALTEVSLPRSLTVVKGNPFLNCKKLKTVKLAKNHPALEIKSSALIVKEDQRLVWYPQTTKTKKYTVPKGVKIISGLAFTNCKQLTEVIVPEGVEEIQAFVFQGCAGIKAFTLPESLKKIEKTAFQLNADKQDVIDATFTVPRGSYAENFCESYKLKTKVK